MTVSSVVHADAAASVAETRNGADVVREFVGGLSTVLTSAVDKIKDVNDCAHVLALNARIEASRAGVSGAAFSVVAQEMQSLSCRTDEIASQMARETRASIERLLEVVDSSVRGSRLSDMALTNIDLIDRNLYERTCDVRWWATDSSLVDALTTKSPEAVAHASHRLGVILDAYTVYHDLVLCDLHGRVLANGRPDAFSAVGQNVASSTWFEAARRTASGEQFGFQSAHRSKLTGDRNVLIYSCGVREGGQAHGTMIGVLGIVFNWEDFAQTIVRQTPLCDSERASSRCCICDSQGNLLADTSNEQLLGKLDSDLVDALFHETKNFKLMDWNGRPACVAHARAPGFETYTTGWHSVIVQRLS